MKEAKCIECGVEFKYHPAVKRGKFCSNPCQGKFKSKQQAAVNIELLKKGQLKDNNRQRIKKALIDYGVIKQCSVCEIKDWMGKPIPFILDHIDGNPFNNTIQNLRFLCSNCDSQTENYKGKNKGNGRKSRIKQF